MLVIQAVEDETICAVLKNDSFDSDQNSLHEGLVDFLFFLSQLIYGLSPVLIYLENILLGGTERLHIILELSLN